MSKGVHVAHNELEASLQDQRSQGGHGAIPLSAGMLLVTLGVVNTGVGCLLYFSAVAKLPVQTVAVVGYLEPLSAVVFSAVLLGEAITPVRLMGAALIIGGAIFCELAGKRAGTKTGIAQTARA